MRELIRRLAGRDRRYGSGVGSTAPRVAPLPRPAELERYSGLWVAILDGEVTAAEPTSNALALRLHGMDHRKRRRLVVEYVRPTTDAYIVGVG